MEPDTQKMKENDMKIPGAIIIAGALVGAAIFFSNSSSEVIKTIPEKPNTDTSAINIKAAKNIAPVTDADHFQGNPSAPVVVVEYSDFECPFCKVFHATMQEVMNTYGKDGKVAWVYRHFPLDALHSKARKEAIATECAGKLGGDVAFWAFADRLFALTPSNNGLDLSLLPQIAEYAKVDRTAFETCLASGEFDVHIEEEYRDAVDAGGEGTPFSVIAVNGEVLAPVSGAEPYARMKELLDIALGDKK